MIQWLQLNWGSLLVGLVLIALLSLLAWSLIRSKRQGKGGCGCGCNACALQGKCHAKRNGSSSK